MLNSFPIKHLPVHFTSGEILQFQVIRTPPGRGNVTVNWEIIGQNLELNFANFTGQLFFPEVRPQRRALPNMYREDRVFEKKENSDYVKQGLMEGDGRATCSEH